MRKAHTTIKYKMRNYNLQYLTTRCVIITGTPNFYGAKFSQYAVYLH